MQPYYDKDGITIFNARCEQVLPCVDPVDLLLTDPPYGINACNRSDGGVGSIASGSKYYGRAEWDRVPQPQWLIDQAVAMGKWAIVWGGNFYNLPRATCLLVWDKMQRDFTFADAEIAWTNLESSVRIMSYSRGQLVAEGKTHPTQKPLPVIQWCLQQAPKEIETIIDPWMGSGTTLVAAKLAGKRAIGIEINTEYCDSAIKRLRQGVLELTG